MTDSQLTHFSRIAVSPAGSDVPIMVNRDTNGSGYWDDPVSRVALGEMELRLVDFFDWDELGMRDFTYLRVRIVASAAYPHLVNRDALLECAYVKVQTLDGAAGGCTRRRPGGVVLG